MHSFGRLEKERDFGEHPCLYRCHRLFRNNELASRKSKGKTDFGHIADLQIKDGLQMAPNHPELLFLEAKRALFNKEKRKQVEQIFAERRSRAMMPKFFLGRE